MKTVLFDFGRVLGNFDKMWACARFAETSPYSTEEIAAIISVRLEKLLESGAMSSTAFCNELLHRCEVEKLTVPDVMRIWGDIFSPNPAIMPVVNALISQGTPIGVISNTNSIHWPFIMDLPVMRALQEYRAPFTLSYEVRASKPDKVMYETALKRLRSSPEDTLYIDDIPEYVEAARALGMRAEVYDCTENPALISEIMMRHGVLAHEHA